MIAEARVTRIDVLAVGGDYADIPRAVELVTDRALRVVRVEWTGDIADHRPRVEHGRRRDDLTVRTGGGGNGVGVVRVGVLHGVAPMADHRLVHCVTGAVWRARGSDW